MTLFEKIRLGASSISGTISGAVKAVILVAVAGVPFLVCVFAVSQLVATVLGQVPGAQWPGFDLRIDLWVPVLSIENWADLTSITVAAGVVSLFLLAVAKATGTKWLFFTISAVWGVPVSVLGAIGVLCAFPFVFIALVWMLGPFNEHATLSHVLGWLSLVFALCGLAGSAWLVQLISDPSDRPPTW